MTIQRYMTEVGMRFWRSDMIGIFFAVTEWCVFLCFSIRIKKRKVSTWPLAVWVLGNLLFPVEMVLLSLRHYEVTAHCVLAMVLWSLYLILYSMSTWQAAVFEAASFCLLLELGKSLCRDGLLASGLMRLMPSLSENRLNSLMGGMYLFYLLISGIYFWLRSEKKEKLLPIRNLQLLGMMFPFILYLVVRRQQYKMMAELTGKAWFSWDLLQYAIAACALIVMATTKQMVKTQLERNELLTEKMLFTQREQQYLVQKEAVEAVNRRYHDLKHYVHAVEALLKLDEEEKAPEKGLSKNEINTRQRQGLTEFLQSLKQEIAPYERRQETGNEVMDILLAERMAQCEKLQIRLIPYIDARRLDLLQVTDLCALFGNAMDNAVEATQRLKYVNMKEIEVKIGTSDEFLVMNFRNFYDGEPKLKTNDELHGYGLRNIREIVARYQGSMDYGVTGQEFQLSILIPLMPV